MTDKSQTMWASIAVVVGVIMFANMGGGGTFSVSGKAADAEAPSAETPRPEERTPPSAREIAASIKPDHTVNTRRGEPSIITYKSGEQKIEESIAQARAHLGHFWTHLEKPGFGERSFTLKVGFPVTNSDGKWGREHIWVAGVKRSGATISGRLDNDPDLLTGVKSGDTVTFTDDMVTDWGFASNNGLIGFYSTRAMLDDAPPAEAARLRAMMGENPT